MSGTSPTSRSLKVLRAQGYTCGVVEKWNAHVGIRQDFCGGIDVIAFRGQRDYMGIDRETFFTRPVVVGVQCCASSGLAAHRTKLLAELRMREWIAAGGRLVLHAWSKKGAKGRRKLWTLTEEEIRIEHFDTPPVAEPMLCQDREAEPAAGGAFP